MLKKLLLSFFLLIASFCFSQIKGTIKSSDNNTLSFVNIYIENTYQGTTSNDNGVYELDINKPGTYTIVFKYLGYKTLKKTIPVETFPFELDAVLEDEEISLDEVVISNTENPAIRIIKQAIANRQNNLEKIKAYQANFYSRGLIRVKDIPEKFLGQDIGDLDGALDSTRSGIIYLSETISKLDYQYPDKLKEHIIASKVSGNNNGFSFNAASDINFNYYKNTISLGTNIISPIADYALNYYNYKLDGVFYDDLGNLINKIIVIPKRPNDPVFTGAIYIVENSWSIYAVDVSISGQQANIIAADTLTIKQNFSYSKNHDIWVLISQTIDISFSFLGFKGSGYFTGVYSDYIFNPDFNTQTFSKEIVSYAEKANKKDSLFWQTKRPMPLTTEEIKDYLKKDSLEILRKSKPYLDSIDAENNTFKITDIVMGYNYKNSYEDWNLGYTSALRRFNFNTIQGYNSNLELFFRKNLNDYKRYISANANFNYGFSDKRLRATASFTYKINNITKPFLILSGGITTQQFNESDPILPLINSISTLFFEDNYMKLYDKSFVKANYSEELFNGFKVYSYLSYERRKALFNNTDQVFINDDNDVYTSNNPLQNNAYKIKSFNTHNIVLFNFSAEIKFGQQYMSYPDTKVNIDNNKYPTLYLHYRKGFAASIADYNYDRIALSVTQNLDISNKGNFIYNIKSGTFFNANNIAFTDYKHFNGNETHINPSERYTDVFNNLPYYTLSTNKSYLAAHAEHDFKGYILGKIPLLNKLDFSLVLGAHALSTINNKPYYELFAGLNNIGWGKFRVLRFDYVRSYQNGFKGDAFIFGLKFLNVID